MKRTIILLAIALQPISLMSCSGSSGSTEEAVGVLEEELHVSNHDTHLYFRCSATGFDPTPATRLQPTGQNGVYSLSYSVTQDWMVSGFDHCSFTETNQLDGWGTFQDHYGADGGNPIIVPGSGTIRVDGADWFNVRYPALGTYTINVTWPGGAFSIQSSGSCSPTLESCNGLDDDCDGLIDESYVCMAPATAPTIDELITTCPSAAVLDAIDQDFDIRFEYLDEDGDGDLDDPAPEGNALRCTAASGSRNLTQSQERTYQVLIALRALQFNQPLPFTNLNLYDWMRRSIRGIRIRSDVDGSFCCTPPPDGSGSYINIQNGANRGAYITDLWTSDGDFGLFGQTQLFVHEARHANPEAPLHCAGGGDDTIAGLGAWGAVYYFSRALAFDSNPCFVRPTPGRPVDPVEYPGQLTANDSYLINAREFSRGIHRTRFCSEPTVPVEPPEPVFACGG